MRTAILILSVVGLSASWARANGPVGVPPSRLSVVNQCDGAVEVRLGNAPPVVLAPLQSTNQLFPGGAKVTVTAKLVGTSLSATKSFTLNMGVTTNVAVRTNAAKTRLTLEPISGQLAMSRESAMVLASTGGLLPLLLLGCLLGREPRRRGKSGNAPTSADDASPSDPT